ncbi:carboxylesterase family protein [Companilactobacillus halodurans]|uniref:Carboxylic ester hydrolase n=1 Tax=Companilactobacillus halodurans TaxID=2584183 RepID=A0A5P0ZVQ2_9LACO|nr:carboxylesterase family protein [Companilactobacillus halodurans]MQS96898.1 carboxylesterase family protein [Companilactobacillus halodurans]
MKKIIKTTTGTYHGTVDHDHIDFLGIPFGYGRRFKRAEEFSLAKFGPNEVNKLHYAVHHGVQPMQDEALDQSNKLRFGENCLNLDICTPDIEGKYPIVIELYGGGFLRGGNHSKQMSWLDHESVVHVVPNYRLGLFGWSKVEGGDTNVGLSDQLMAIQWVIDNAKSFGGDIKNLTLVGLSAGAKSVSALMSSNSNLLDWVKKIIVFSGGVQTIRDLQTAKKVTENICRDNNIKSTQDLFNLTDDGLQLVQEHTLGTHISTNWFGPVIDDDLISSDWQDKLIQRVKRTHFKTIISAGTNELGAYRKMNINHLENEVMVDLFGENAGILKQSLIKEPYSKNEFVKMLGMAMYTLPGRRLAELLTQRSDAEVYCNLARVYEGQHGGVIRYLNTPETEINIDYRKNRRNFLNLLRDFIATGKPYVEDIKYEWPLYDNDRLVLELDSDDLKSVSIIGHRYPDDLPWQSYKL